MLASSYTYFSFLLCICNKVVFKTTTAKQNLFRMKAFKEMVL